MKEDNFKLYVHTCIFNNMKYFGITIQEPEKRWRKGKGYEGQYFYKGILEFGWENFTHKVLLDHLTRQEANRLEREYIKKYKTNNKLYGWNIDEGGNHEGCRSKKTKDKISKTMRNKKINIGDKNPMYGKIADNAKKIICIETGEVFNSITDASKKLNLDFRLISAVCRGKRNTTGRLHFCYLKDYNPNKKYDLRVGDEYNTKKIICIETNVVFNSIIECAKIMNINKNSIGLVCRGKQKTAGGYRFTYYVEN